MFWFYSFSFSLFTIFVFLYLSAWHEMCLFLCSLKLKSFKFYLLFNISSCFFYFCCNIFRRRWLAHQSTNYVHIQLRTMDCLCDQSLGLMSRPISALRFWVDKLKVLCKWNIVGSVTLKLFGAFQMSSILSFQWTLYCLVKTNYHKSTASFQRLTTVFLHTDIPEKVVLAAIQ